MVDCMGTVNMSKTAEELEYHWLEPLLLLPDFTIHEK
jgi:hypothetical protein